MSERSKKEFNFCPFCGRKLIIREVADADRMVKRLCCPSSEACGFIHYNNPTPVCGAIVENEDGSIVLIRNKGWPSNWYGIVTGFLESSDSDPESCIIREVKEELGCDGVIVKLLGAYGFQQQNQVIIVYHVKAKGPIIPNWEELDGVKSLALNEIQPWPGATGQAMKEFLKSRKPYPPSSNL